MKKVKKQILVALFLNVQILHNSSILTDKRNITFPRPTPLVAEKIFSELTVCPKSNERCWATSDDVLGEDSHVKFFTFRDIYKIKYSVIKVTSKCPILRQVLLVFHQKVWLGKTFIPGFLRPSNPLWISVYHHFWRWSRYICQTETKRK